MIKMFKNKKHFTFSLPYKSKTQLKSREEHNQNRLKMN